VKVEWLFNVTGYTSMYAYLVISPRGFWQMKRLKILCQGFFAGQGCREARDITSQITTEIRAILLYQHYPKGFFDRHLKYVTA
jgi:hypothetical protein